MQKNLNSNVSNPQEREKSEIIVLEGSSSPEKKLRSRATGLDQSGEGEVEVW